MKKSTTLFTLLLLLGIFSNSHSYAQNTECNVTVSFTTVESPDLWEFNNMLAVWIEDEKGSFIRTLKVMADANIDYLYTWQEASAGNTIDAITGATRTSHAPETLTWDGKDTNKTVVADGAYLVKIEFAESQDQGPVISIPFTKGTVNSDSTYNNETNFTNINIEYTVGGTNQVNEAVSATNFNIFPNPVVNQSIISILSDKATVARLSLYSLNGQLIRNLGAKNLTIGQNSIAFDANDLPAGPYLLRLESNNSIKILKIVKH